MLKVFEKVSVTSKKSPSDKSAPALLISITYFAIGLDVFNPSVDSNLLSRAEYVYTTSA